MKKTTLALASLLFAFTAQAQTFPSPYCDITDAADVTVEQVTSVNFAGTSINNSDVTSVLVNETATVVNVTQGQIYAISVEGFTDGPFDNDIVAFIDWNQNDILDDAGEIYEIGTLFNSTGSDGNSVTLNIAVPTDAILGNTRIRITKTYQDEDSPAIIDPCGILFDPFGMGIYAGYGQALDFTLNIETAAVFPNPYCDIVDPTDVTVEQITLVDFAGTTIENLNTTSVLVDETATVVNVDRGEAYAMIVDGFTDGPFDNDIVAFIDWNHNGVLDDAGEVYQIGTLFNSTGSDGDSVSLNITIPTDALLGSTRVRITKTYQDVDSPAIIDPCGILFDPFGMGIYGGYGQALDFTLNIGLLSVESFDTQALSVYPIPTQDVLNIKYKSALQSVKIYNMLGQEVLRQNTSEAALQVNVTTLAAGAYIVKLFTEQGQHSIRILKE